LTKIVIAWIEHTHSARTDEIFLSCHAICPGRGDHSRAQYVRVSYPSMSQHDHASYVQIREDIEKYDRLKKNYEDPTFEVVSGVFRALSKKKIISLGSFKR
jgi:structure-specific recognition protein 1